MRERLQDAEHVLAPFQHIIYAAPSPLRVPRAVSGRKGALMRLSPRFIRIDSVPMGVMVTPLLKNQLEWHSS